MMERLRITESQVHALNEQMHRLIGNAQDLGQDHPHD
ncbi:hypothetical protein PGAAJM_10710 [Kocuria varians]